MQNISDKSLRENQTHFMLCKSVPENHTVHDIMWENIVQPTGHDDNIRRRKHPICIPDNQARIQTHTHNI